MTFEFVEAEGKFPNGMRNSSGEPLTEEEIDIVKREIQRIEADESRFVFNDPEHMDCTCYDPVKDLVFVAKDVFPDMTYGSTHPRDIMSVAAILAHEYYGHRTYRDEYINNFRDNVKTTPNWEDEYRADIAASKTTPNLTDRERHDLVWDAIYKAEEAGIRVKLDSYIMEVLYGINI